MPFDYLMDRLGGRAPGATKAVRELNKNLPKQSGGAPAPKPTSVKGLAGKLLKGTNAYFIAEALKPYTTDPLGKFLGNELTQGILTVAGATAEQKAMAAGLPVVKSVGKTDFNISTPEGKEAYKKALNATKSDDPKRTPGGGLNTGTGKVETYDSFQEQQAALMGGLGITSNPFSSTRLATTSDSIYNTFPTGDDVPDFGVDPSKMLTNVDTEKLGELYNNPDRETTFRISDDPMLQDYVPPVNYNTGQGSVDPKFYPEQQSSMKAMRMKDRDLGLMYASGQFFAEGSDGKPVLVNRELAKDVRRGKEGAADQLAAYLAGGGIKPQGGVIRDIPKQESLDVSQTPTSVIEDSGYSAEDAESFGVPKVNADAMGTGKDIFYDIDDDFDPENDNGQIIGGLTSPISKYLSY